MKDDIEDPAAATGEDAAPGTGARAVRGSAARGAGAGAPPRRALRALLAVGAALVLTLLVAAGLKGHQDLASAKARAADLERQIAKTDGNLELLRERIARLRDDPELLERLAREEVGLIRPGDVVLVFPEP